MLRVQSLWAVAVLFVAEGYASAQHAIIKPGDVIAGKTLTAASDIAVSDTGRLVFRGAFEEGGKQQAALFDYDLSTQAAKLIASTETPFDGFALTDLGQPSLSSKGKLVWRGETDQGAVIFGDDGPLVETGDTIAPGKTAVDPYEPLINDNGARVYFDLPGGYQYPSTQAVTFPWTMEGKSIGAPLMNSSDFADLGFVTFVDSNLGAIVGFIPNSGDGGIQIDIGDRIGVDHFFVRGYSASTTEKLVLAYVADLQQDNPTHQVLRSVVLRQSVLVTENSLVDGKRLGAVSELQLTSGFQIFVASEGRIIQLPEPGSIGLALIGAIALALPLLCRLRPWSTKT